jgi:hypothetical protein
VPIVPCPHPLSPKFYGGIFIILSLLWAWKVDNFKPDRYDIIGALKGNYMQTHQPRDPGAQGHRYRKPKKEDHRQKRTLQRFLLSI